MKIEIWNDVAAFPKYYVRLGKHPDIEGIFAWIVDEIGEHVEGGTLLYVNEDGTLGRWRAVDPTAAKMAGIPLDDKGRWKLP